MRHLTLSEKDTQNLGKKYGKDCKGGEIFLLSGELGGGKTQFVKGLALGLGVSDRITSPTFNYEKIYRGSDLTLYHFDLYRENTLDNDIKALMQEAFSDTHGVTAIEWSERMGDFRPKSFFEINFSWKDENEREILIKSQNQISNDK